MKREKEEKKEEKGKREKGEKREQRAKREKSEKMRKRSKREELGGEREPVAKRHYEVSGSLALLH